MKEDRTIYQQLADDLKCAFCLTLLAHPMITECGHMFCDKCIVDYLKTKTQCPLCKSKITESSTLLAPKQIVNLLAKLNKIRKSPDHPYNRIKRSLNGTEIVQLDNATQADQKKLKLVPVPNVFTSDPQRNQPQTNPAPLYSINLTPQRNQPQTHLTQSVANPVQFQKPSTSMAARQNYSINSSSKSSQPNVTLTVTKPRNTPINSQTAHTLPKNSTSGNTANVSTCPMTSSSFATPKSTFRPIISPTEPANRSNMRNSFNNENSSTFSLASFNASKNKLKRSATTEKAKRKRIKGSVNSKNSFVTSTPALNSSSNSVATAFNTQTNARLTRSLKTAIANNSTITRQKSIELFLLELSPIPRNVQTSNVDLNNNQSKLSTFALTANKSKSTFAKNPIPNANFKCDTSTLTIESKPIKNEKSQSIKNDPSLMNSFITKVEQSEFS